MWHVWGSREVHIAFWLGKLKETDHLDDQGIDRMILKLIFKELGVTAWAGFIWFRIDTSGGLL
jgi:hypothetical protein